MSAGATDAGLIARGHAAPCKHRSSRQKAVRSWLAADPQCVRELAPVPFSEEVIRFADPDGILFELVASPATGDVEPWDESNISTVH